jgi:hypothetical protein
MEENLNDPKFLAYVNAVGSIQYVGDDVLSNATKLSYPNTCMVLSQWVNAGKHGQPTYLATKRQWSKFFKRDVVPGATPLYIVNPKDVTHRSIKQTMADYGVSQAQFDANPMIQKQIDTLDKTNKKQEKEINELTIINNKYKEENLKLKEVTETYVEENKYLKSLLDFEIKNVERYLYELVELNNKKNK